MNEFPMTYDESLAVITACCNGARNKYLKDALQVAQHALRAEIGRGRRFDTDLESAESDYVTHGIQRRRNKQIIKELWNQ